MQSLNSNHEEPWQLRLFRKSLKKRQKLDALLSIIGTLEKRDNCLLLTCGDNNGALNWHIKHHGGSWTWADSENESILQISALTDDRVLEIDKSNPLVPTPDNTFDLVVTIDVHEHLECVDQFNQELKRVVKPDGRVIVTTPGGEQQKLANRIKNWVGMDKKDYGHVVDGYDIPALMQQLSMVDLQVVAESSYSRFFTEIMELGINLIYVKFLARRSQAKVEKGQIAPQNLDQMKSVEKTIRLYSLIFPVLWFISQLDQLLLFTNGYAVIVEARKVSL
jgi:SAM-dependent methyltransferase